jgi:hypothetical protein
MSIHLQRFVDRVRGFEARETKDFTMSMTDAKDLHADITKLLIELQDLREKLQDQSEQNQVITVEMTGGKF